MSDVKEQTQDQHTDLKAEVVRYQTALNELETALVAAKAELTKVGLPFKDREAVRQKAVTLRDALPAARADLAHAQAALRCAEQSIGLDALLEQVDQAQGVLDELEQAEKDDLALTLTTTKAAKLIEVKQRRDVRRVELAEAKVVLLKAQFAAEEASIPTASQDVRAARARIEAVEAEQRRLAVEKLAIQRSWANGENAVRDHKLRCQTLKDAIFQAEQAFREIAISTVHRSPYAQRVATVKKQQDTSQKQQQRQAMAERRKQATATAKAGRGDVAVTTTGGA